MDGVDGVRAGVTASGPWATGSGYRFTPLLRANPGGGWISPTHGSGYPGPSPEGGGHTSHFRLVFGSGCPRQSHGKTGMVL